MRWARYGFGRTPQPLADTWPRKPIVDQLRLDQGHLVSSQTIGEL